MTSHWTTPTNSDHSICQRIQIRIHYESESRFDQIEYGLNRDKTLETKTKTKTEILVLRSLWSRDE